MCQFRHRKCGAAVARKFKLMHLAREEIIGSFVGVVGLGRAISASRRGKSTNNGDPYGIRTRISAVKGQRPNH